jgi:hypothetical protein
MQHLNINVCPQFWLYKYTLNNINRFSKVFSIKNVTTFKFLLRILMQYVEFTYLTADLN